MYKTLRLMVTLLFAAIYAHIAYGEDANAIKESVITAKFSDRSISALVTHLEKHQPFKRAIVLFPGHPGIMKIQAVDSFQLKGNFLIRTRQFWLDEETIVFSVDAPTDQWSSFTGRFRGTDRYAEDLKGLAKEIESKFGELPLILIGTSEGSITAYYAARVLDSENNKVIFSSSLFNNSANSSGLASLDLDEIKIPMLWVHHESDPCRFTPYWLAKKYAEKTYSPLITVRSGNTGRGDDCQAFSRHGYFGVEKQTVMAMKDWIVNGEVKDVIVP